MAGRNYPSTLKKLIKKDYANVFSELFSDDVVGVKKHTTQPLINQSQEPTDTIKITFPLSKDLYFDLMYFQRSQNITKSKLVSYFIESYLNNVVSFDNESIVEEMTTTVYVPKKLVEKLDLYIKTYNSSRRKTLYQITKHKLYGLRFT